MKRRIERVWIAALCVAFLVGLAAGLPARLVLKLAPSALAARVSAVDGTLWRGHARLAIADLEPAAISWRLAPSSLLVAAPRLALELTHPLGRFDGVVVLHDGSSEVVDGGLSTTLSPLARFAGLPPGTLLGSVEAHGIDATLDAEGIRSLTCTGTVSGVTVTGDGTPLALGDLGVSCSDTAAGPTIAISDRGGPLVLQASVGFAPGWRYLVDGTAGARPGAPAALAQALPLLGRADGPDRIRFRYTGELLPR